MAKKQSRSKRWFDAVSEAQAAFEKVQEQSDVLAEKIGELHEVQQEYQDWMDNLPENLENSALGEKLSAVCEIDIESLTSDPLESWTELEGILAEAESADLPQGFGRD